MRTSNILLIICLFFILLIFFISPHLMEQKKALHSLEKDGGIFVGKIVEEPDVRSNNTKLTVKAEKGKILVTTNNYPEYQYGDVLKIKGELKEPLIFEDFNYRNYLAKEGIYSVIYYPEIEILERNKGSIFYQTIFKFKNSIKKEIEKIMPFPEVSILEAITLGYKQGLSEKIKESLNISGVRHIVAISGMHIVILSWIIMYLLIGLGLWRNQAFYFAIGLIVLFIIMVGAPSSAIRAGIMGSILLLGQKMGRLSDSGRIVVFAATIMLIFNPLLLRYDVGFQLSFLAVLGIIYIKPIFDKWLEKITQKEKIKWWFHFVTMTLAAQIATLPILIYNFGRISFVSPLTNVLIVPAIPYIMGLGLLFNFSAVIFSLLAKVLLWPLYIGLTYIICLTNSLSQLPFSAKEISNLHWLWLIGYYILLIGLLIWYKRKQDNQRITRPQRQQTDLRGGQACP